MRYLGLTTQIELTVLTNLSSLTTGFEDEGCFQLKSDTDGPRQIPTTLDTSVFVVNRGHIPYCLIGLIVHFLKLANQELTDESLAKLEEIVQDSGKAQAIIDSGKISMGTFTLISLSNLED